MKTTITNNATINNTIVKGDGTMVSVLPKKESFMKLTREEIRTLLELVNVKLSNTVFRKTNKEGLFAIYIEVVKGLLATAEEAEKEANKTKDKEEVIETVAGDMSHDRYYPDAQAVKKKDYMENKIIDDMHKSMFKATYKNKETRCIKYSVLCKIIKYDLPEKLRTNENVKKVLYGMFKKGIIRKAGADFCNVLM